MAGIGKARTANWYYATISQRRRKVKLIHNHVLTLAECKFSCLKGSDITLTPDLALMGCVPEV
jgi:hypothetical protein